MRTQRQMTSRGLRLAALAAAAMSLAACGSGDNLASEAAALDTSSTTVASTAFATVAPPPMPVGPKTSATTTAPPDPSIAAATTAAPSTTTIAPLPLSTCAAADLPSANNTFAPVMVSGIKANDSDGGLNIRTGPGKSNAVQFALPNGSMMTATGPCEKTSKGTVWWEVEDGGLGWSGWASASYLVPFVPGSTTCPQQNFNPIGKGTVESILGDYDGDGGVDALFLAYDGVVQAPNQWTGSTATLQIQFSDGGLSNAVSIASMLGDGGPQLGMLHDPAFPTRIDPANTMRSVGVISSSYAGSATGAGESMFIGVSGCSPSVVAQIAVTPSAGSPQRPFLCAAGGGGRVQLHALDGLTAGFDYLVTKYAFQGSTFVQQPQVVAGNANTDSKPTTC